ncbi:hypothetical protein [Cyanobium sp. ATX 6A2]|uniref:hypothetical protein n=1 Tax=Cyanobium sp. ATX 6A2 TaxID=2823700 RepID=UPI0037BE38E9
MCGKLLGFGDYEQTTSNYFAKCEKFLADMDLVVPWLALIKLIEPHYPKTGSMGGRPPYPVATILRMHRLQQ